VWTPRLPALNVNLNRLRRNRKGAATLKRIFFFVPALFLAFSTPSRADDAPVPCANEDLQLSTQKYGTPGYDSANKTWQACLALAAQQKKAEYAATRNTWAASLDKLPNGGWEYLGVMGDGTYAFFGSHRHAIREGNIVSIWLRYEYRDQQATNANERFKSDVVRQMFDCTRMTTKSVATTYYPENNLDGIGPSYVYDETKVGWAPAIPGTVGDTLLDWACKTVPRAPAAKP
jgi:hypothetical protein